MSGDARRVDVLVTVDRGHRINCTGLGEVGCIAYAGWHSWDEHRRHVAQAQIAALRSEGLLP